MQHKKFFMIVMGICLAFVGAKWYQHHTLMQLTHQEHALAAQLKELAQTKAMLKKQVTQLTQPPQLLNFARNQLGFVPLRTAQIITLAH